MRQRESASCGMSATLTDALDRHFMACAAVATAAAGVLGYAEHADAAIIYSGTQNVVQTNADPGLYINLVTKAVGARGSIPAGWDINPYVNAPGGSGTFAIYTPSTTGVVVDGSGNGAKLTAGATIGPSNSFGGGYPGPVLTTGTTGPWTGASTGSDFLGVKFVESGVNGGNPVFGWIRITKGAGVPANSTSVPSGITYVDWAYDNSGAAITAGAGAPEPSSLGLLAAGAVGLMVRRGRAKLRRTGEAA